MNLPLCASRLALTILSWLPLALTLPPVHHPSLTLGPDLTNVSTHSPFGQPNTPPSFPIVFRVPDTHTTIHFHLDPTQPIAKLALGQTILRTQQRIKRGFVSERYTEDTPLFRGEDPYESDEIYEGCFFGVATWPLNSHLLTYGMVYEVLQGLWLFMYRQERFIAAVFQVRQDGFGMVGVGKIQPDRLE